MTTIQNVLPNLAELFAVLAHCTNEDVDEILRFVKILLRGREGAADVQPPIIFGVKNNSGRPPSGTLRASGHTMRASSLVQGARDRSPRRTTMASLSNGNRPFVSAIAGAALKSTTGQNTTTQDHDAYYYQGHQLDPRVIAQVEKALDTAPPGDQDAAKNAIAYCKGNPEMNNGLFAVFGKYCRNCYLGGAGFANTPKHSMMECRIAGNPCMIPCKNCPDGGLHWSDQCPGRNKHSLQQATATAAEQVTSEDGY